jgi:hypothetical protein
MTSLAVALAVDSRGPTAIYLITDSRLTWNATASQRWDGGQKTFASARTPDIFGFCGDAFFPPMILRQFLDQVNSSLIFPDDMNADERHSALTSMLKRSSGGGSGSTQTRGGRVGPLFGRFAILYMKAMTLTAGGRHSLWASGAEVSLRHSDLGGKACPIFLVPPFQKTRISNA